MKIPWRRICAPAFVGLLLSSCASQEPELITTADTSRETGLRSKMENGIVEAVIAKTIEDVAAISPEIATRIGASESNTRWDPADINLIRSRAISSNADLLRETVDPGLLSASNRAALSLLLFADAANKRLMPHEGEISRINHINGPQYALPDHLIKEHPARSADDFEDYIARVGKFDAVVHTWIKREPRPFTDNARDVKARVAAQCARLMQGSPFERGGPSPLLEDFSDKIAAAGIERQTRLALTQELSDTLRRELAAGCDRLKNYYQAIAAEAENVNVQAVSARALTEDDQAFYRARLFAVTSVEVAPQDIHEDAIAAAEVSAEKLDAAITSAGLSRDLLSNDPGYRFGNDANNKHEILNTISNIIFDLDADLGKIVSHAPSVDLEIRILPDFEQVSPIVSSYTPPSAANYFGILYVNPSHLRTTEVASRAYAHSIPGSHLIASTPLSAIISVPSFTEGWAMYAADLPFELGLDTSPLSIIGRYQLATYTAATCAVDTGIHTGAWTKADAAAYLARMLPIQPEEADSVALAIELDPASACAGFVGAKTFMQLRHDAKLRLKDKFRLTEFHDALLSEGVVPLATAEALVSTWINKTIRFD